MSPITSSVFSKNLCLYQEPYEFLDHLHTKDHPVNCLLSFSNKTGSSQLIFVGAWFQFTWVDRQAWNSLVTESEIPNPDVLLGVSWARTTRGGIARYFKDAMPRTPFRVSDLKSGQSPFLNAKAHYSK